jgi:F420-dependent oxidoreductase-like protein
VELTANVDMSLPVGRLRGYLGDVEAAGADMVWIAEAYGRDAASQLGYCAAATSKMRLGSGILNVYSRSAALLAQTAATIDELTGGRFELGLGSSGPQVVEGWHGLPFEKPLARTRDVVAVCRQVWRRERLSYTGAAIQVPIGARAGADPGTAAGKPLMLMNRPVRAAIPIWLASVGPRNVRLTAEIADGWLPTLFIPELAARVWGDELRAGRAQRDAALPPLRIGASAHIEVTGDAPSAIRAARDRARPSLALYIGGMGSAATNFYNRLIRRYGYTADAERVQKLYLDGQAAAAAAALSEELVEALTVCGPASYVRDRLASYAAAGVTSFRVNVNAGADGPRAIEQLRALLP